MSDTCAELREGVDGTGIPAVESPFVRPQPGRETIEDIKARWLEKHPGTVFEDQTVRVFRPHLRYDNRNRPNCERECPPDCDTDHLPVSGPQLRLEIDKTGAIEREILSRPCTDWERPLIGMLRAHRGIENAITSEELGALVHVPGRQIRARINHLRAVHHVPVCASTTESKTQDRKAGYYWPKSYEEFIAWLNRARKTQLEEKLALDGAQAGASAEFGTMELPFERTA